MPQPIRARKGPGQETGGYYEAESRRPLAFCIAVRISRFTISQASILMPDSKTPDSGGDSDIAQDRLKDDPRAAALRANLAKRKQQTSARRGGKAVGKKEPSVFDDLKDRQG